MVERTFVGIVSSRDNLIRRSLWSGPQVNDLERGGSPVATDRVAMFKISFFSGVKSSDFQWRVISSK